MVFRHVFFAEVQWIDPNDCGKGVVDSAGNKPMAAQAPTWSTFNATGFEYLYLLKADYEKLPPGSVEATWFWVEMFFFFFR